MSQLARKVFDGFAGHWQLKRTITHNKTSAVDTATGQASFVIVDNKCIYEEAVDIKFSHLPRAVKGTQAYEYKYDKKTESISKKSADRKTSYKLDILDKSKATGHFICGKDEYIAEYMFISKDNFSINYSVNGPDKAYDIFTEYQRIG